jgi:hypothetical protein
LHDPEVLSILPVAFAPFKGWYPLATTLHKPEVVKPNETVPSTN